MQICVLYMDNSFVSLGYTYSSLSSLFSSEQEAKAVGPTGLELFLFLFLWQNVWQR